jgi:hypothetical protein
VTLLDLSATRTEDFYLSQWKHCRTLYSCSLFPIFFWPTVFVSHAFLVTGQVTNVDSLSRGRHQTGYGTVDWEPVFERGLPLREPCSGSKTFLRLKQTFRGGGASSMVIV